MSQSHLFYTITKTPEKDKSLERFIKNSENCRRQCMLESIGSPNARACSTATDSNFKCCDCCCPFAPTPPSYCTLDVLKPSIQTRRKRKRAVRTVDKKCLREQLVRTREEFLSQRSDFRMVGVGFVCADGIIDKLCDEAKYIENVDDLSPDFNGVRADLKLLFFAVIRDTCSLI